MTHVTSFRNVINFEHIASTEFVVFIRTRFSQRSEH